MMKRPRYIFVLFSSPLVPNTGSRWLRFKRRSILWLVSVFSRSPIVHCAVECDGRILNPSLTGTSTHDADTVRWAFSWAIEVPGVADLNSHIEDPPRPKNIINSLMRWLTRGRWPSHDCVTITSSLLMSAGVVVPRRITTPALLFTWLRSQGYPLHDIAGDWTDYRGSDNGGTCKTHRCNGPGHPPRHCPLAR